MPIVALWASGEAEFFNVSFQLSFHTASADSTHSQRKLLYFLLNGEERPSPVVEKFSL